MNSQLTILISLVSIMPSNGIFILLLVDVGLVGWIIAQKKQDEKLQMYELY
jgi:hypothetical protein